MIYVKKALLISIALFIMWLVMAFTVISVPVLWIYGALLRKTTNLKPEGVSLIIDTADGTLKGIFMLIKGIYHCKDLKELP